MEEGQFPVGTRPQQRARDEDEHQWGSVQTLIAKLWFGVKERERWVHVTEDSVRSRVVIRPLQDFLDPDRTDAIAYKLLRDIYESGDSGLRVESATIPWFTAELRFVPAR